MNKNTTEVIRNSYIVIFVIILILSITNYIIIELMMNTQKKNLKLLEPLETIEYEIINSSDTIELILHTIKNNTMNQHLHGQTQARLLKNAKILEKSLLELELKAKQNHIPLLSVNIDKYLYQKPHFVKKQLINLIAHLRSFSQLSYDAIYWQLSTWAPIEAELSKENSLYKGTKKISEMIYQQTTQKFIYLSNLHNFLIPLTLFTLIIEVYYVFVPIFRGISLRDRQLKSNYEKIKKLAYTDDLVEKIGNRRAFMSSLKVLDNKDNYYSYCIMLMDLDKFKSVNSLCGQRGGDFVLKEIGERIQTFLQPHHGKVFRIGGDEFAIIIKDQTIILDIESYALNLFNIIHKPIEYEGHTLCINASIGITIRNKEDNLTIEDSLNQANLSLLMVKKKDNKPIYNYASKDYDKIFDSRSLSKSLINAINHCEIIPYYQPIVAHSSTEIVCVEALARWKKSNGDILMPLDFLPIIEKYDLMRLMTASMLKQVYNDYISCKKQGIDLGKVSINFTEHLLIDVELPTYICQLLHTDRLDWLQIEVLENVAIDHSKDILQRNLEELKKLGASIALDDYGVGYASLKNLLNIPCDLLKIDRSFITNLLSDRKDQLIVKSIINMAHNLDIQVLIEGVETPAQYDYFKQWENILIQGYYIAKPMPISQVIAMKRKKGNK